MTILVTGGNGRLGRHLQRDGVVALDRERLDICDEDHVFRALAEHPPNCVINGAAYTEVDKAEIDRERAFAINRDGAGILARACQRRGVRLLHVSTDYVFDGVGSRPYREDDACAPLGVYGQSKAAGEWDVHAAGGVVVRTSWLFDDHGPSFVHTMLRLAKERAVLRVVADQHGRPTYTGDLADALLALAARDELQSTYHYANAGETTWHAFATATIEEARRRGAPLACERIDAITTADYPTPATRPAYSVLDTSRISALGIVPPHWSIGLARVVARTVER